MDWLPIETAPPGVRVQLWWKPVGDNPYAETAIFGIVSEHDVGCVWLDEGRLQSIDHITHWRYPPDPPDIRRIGTPLQDITEVRHGNQKIWLNFISEAETTKSPMTI